MNQNEYQVWNLLDPDDMASAVRHVEEQMERTQADLDLVISLDEALAEIEEHLRAMGELARKAREPEADRQALEAAFAASRERLDLVAEAYARQVSPEEGEQLRQLLDSIVE